MMEEKVYAEEVVLSEANGQRSRDVVTLLAGVAYTVGAVLGKITDAGDDWGKYTICDKDANDGSEDALAVLLRDVDLSAEGAEDADGVVLARDAEVRGDKLVYATGATADDKGNIHDDLAAVGIVVRPRVAAPAPPPPPPPPPPGP